MNKLLHQLNCISERNVKKRIGVYEYSFFERRSFLGWDCCVWDFEYRIGL